LEKKIVPFCQFIFSLSTASLLNESSSLAAALGLTEFVGIVALNFSHTLLGHASLTLKFSTLAFP
jgi:hypothetical protein